MIWETVSPGIDRCTFQGYTIARIRGQEFRSGGVNANGSLIQIWDYTYVAIGANKEKITGTDIDKLVTAILKKKQLKLF